jgi:hypothetical protein
MVVEEVSLVDRAANQHRFLVVKRDTPMPKPKHTSKAPAAADDDEQDDELDEADAKPPKGKSKGKPAPSAAKKADKGDALAAATKVLERLTTAIETLEEAEGTDADDALAELASELTDAAETLAELAGAGGGAENTGKDAGVGDAVTKVRALLAEVGDLLEKTREAPAADERAAAREAPPPTAPEGRVTQQLEAVASSLRLLTDAVRDQGARLGRLEKNTALPNSRTHDERPRPSDDGDVGWPLDLNRPKDRESVDKALSFHDR